MMNNTVTHKQADRPSRERSRLGLYLHFPFCRRKCDYCDFYSVVPSKGTQIEEYVDALIQHMARCRTSLVDAHIVDSVFFGGGTPSLLSGGQLSRIMQGLRDNFDLADNCEVTLESNPATVTLDSLRQYRRAGINRLSIGLQSADGCELSELSRLHSVKDFLTAFEEARAAGFDNINIDLMYGIPGQTYDSFMKTLAFVTDLAPEHLSVYGLKIEPGTPLARRDPQTYHLPSEDEECRMYLGCIDYLAEKGYGQYEISNFAKPGYHCRHNMKYWNCDPYIGLGTSAHSCFNNRRYAYVPDIKRYCDTLLSGGPHDPLVTDLCEITKEGRESDYIMLRMRLSEGICTKQFKSMFGKDFDESYAPRLAPYLSAGLVTQKGTRYALTPRGMLVSNAILCDLIDF